MKTDSYLNLCLDQADKSPLRYRHGAIIVRGGKVIGQGYNDYRSGFNGGALKSGRLPLRSHELKSKPEEQEERTQQPVTSPTASSGGGKAINTPLSMHAEMMAIHSALNLSSTSASSAVSFEKPCFKLSSDSNRKARLQRDAVKSYVETVCKAALAQSTTKRSAGQSSVQQWRFEQATCRSNYTETYSSLEGIAGEGGSAYRERYQETPTKERE